MKKTLVVIGIVAIAMVSHAQSTNQQNFVQQVIAWGSSFDTNNVTFLSTSGMLDTGAESRQGDGIPLINDLHASYDLVGATYLTPTNVTVLRFGPDVLERNSGVTGTFVSAQGGIQAAIVHYDFRFGAALDAGYWANQPTIRHHLFGEVCLDTDKAIASRAYLGVRFAQEFPRNAQGYYVKVGFTF